MLSMLLACSLSAVAASDQSQQDGEQSFEELWTLLGMSQMVSILHDEGLSMALASDLDLLGHEGGPRWEGAVQAIYNEKVLQGELHTLFEQQLAQAHLSVLCEFYKTEDMQKIIQNEIAARRAFLDMEFEQTARDRWLQGDIPEVLDETIRQYVDTNDLIELNVMGSLNSNYVFLNTLNQSLPDIVDQMSERDILSHVWSQETDIRTDTTEWIFAYLHTAYAPVDPYDLDRYVAFSATPAGQALNQALFTAFDAVYLRLSGDLGRVVGTLSREEEL
ncbi:hypothetical protein ALP8811_01305 [Aliiroseovarius pelagivivens]|uniref:Uncharacterized protein n=2 Tax=Aliiroseovarius pelagivivens TaxID=1639690 RepID=A0A2R8AJR8_9RHOB|nr:hypothetical protein ALP8811_01305 [Aliiroseovarius pelagivivens]